MRARHTLYLYLCRDENTPGTGSARQCVLVCCWYVVFNVRWCAYNTDYNTDNCVSKLLLDILLLRDLVLIAVLYPILRIAEAGAYRIVKYHTQLAVSSLCITGRHDSVTTVKHTLLLLTSSVSVLCGVYVCCGPDSPI